MSFLTLTKIIKIVSGNLMNVFIYGNAQIDEKIQIFLILFFSLISVSDNLTDGGSLTF